MKIILFNGPPRSGKDTGADAIAKALKAFHIKFSDALKRGVHVSYGLPAGQNLFEHVKDKPLEAFFGMTPRQAYIYHSENYMKVLHGKEVYGRIYTRQLEEIARANPDALVVTADSGFVEEAMPALDRFGPENFLLLRIHREGCTFANDSRNYINLPDVVTHDVINDDLDGYLYEVTGLAWEWLGLFSDKPALVALNP